VLSGFVLAHAYGSKSDFQLDSFLISRVFRLFPLHVVLLAVFIVLEFGKLTAFNFGLEFNSAPFSGVSAPSEIVPNLLLVQSWTKLTQEHSFNYPAWSISVEFFMYIIFAATIMCFCKYRLKSWMALSLASFAMLAFGPGIFTEATLRGIECFFAGSVSYALYRKIEAKTMFVPVIYTALEVFFIVFIVLIVAGSIDFNRILIGLVFCLSTILFAFERGLLSAALKLSTFKHIGALSYSIYLTHAAILFCVISACVVASQIFGVNMAPMVEGVRKIDLGGGWASTFGALTVLILVVIVSSFTYRFIEMPGQRIGRKLIASRSARRKSALLPGNDAL
jgi:peptidoglycan/LPS O-acetylase OafA/YrhL